ncbi:MAG: T9SS type A sorting domain-containing protein [Bacteroidota bacterium]|nr:T9SS type A sorting domain-containing protein [Bacteroidota bacterium]
MAQIVSGQQLPSRYATLELFTNTPCPICASQNPNLFNRLQAYESQYHLISFYPGTPYSSCVFYQSNIPDNTVRFQFYTGEIFGTPTVAINGLDFKSSNGVTNSVMDAVTGNDSWLQVQVQETSGENRTVDITLEDFVGGSLQTGRLFAAIVEKVVHFTAPNGETIHHNVFRDFVGPAAGEEIDLSSGSASKTYNYSVNAGWDADQIYVIAWLSDPVTKEIYNSGTRFDSVLISAAEDILNDEALSIYPNPVSSTLNIDVKVIGDYSVTLYSVLGAKMGTWHNVQKIDVKGIAAGTYVVRVDSKQGVGMRRVVVEN